VRRLPNVIQAKAMRFWVCRSNAKARPANAKPRPANANPRPGGRPGFRAPSRRTEQACTVAVGEETVNVHSVDYRL